MENINITAAFYKDYYYPVILVDKDLKIAYKNLAAQAEKMQSRTGVRIKRYMDTENFKILRNILDGKEDRQVIELKEQLSRCLARLANEMVVLIFFDSLNYIINYTLETAKKINDVLAAYEEQEFRCVDERDNNKMRKIRTYFKRHIANINPQKSNYQKSYCNIWEFYNNFAKGISPFINKFGYKITFDIDEEDKLFIFALHESDFLTLNFILLSYAFSASVFGNLHIRFSPVKGTVIYEFMPVSNYIESGGIDLDLAALIAENNNLKLDFPPAENNINYVEEKTQICVRFISAIKLSQTIRVSNSLKSEDIASRATVELASFQPNLK